MTDASASAAATLLQTIEMMAADAPEEGFSLRDIFDRLDERAFGAALFILSLPVCIPGLYVIPQIVSLPMMALAGQMAAGREEPWLPEKFSRRKINREGLEKTAGFGRKWFGWIERFARPRLQFLTGRLAERIVGAIMCVFCASILVPLPLTNTVPGIAVAIAAFGLMARDGLLVTGGLVLGSVWVTGLIGSVIFGALFVAG